jgi:hypothetical protein
MKQYDLLEWHSLSRRLFYFGEDLEIIKTQAEKKLSPRAKLQNYVEEKLMIRNILRWLIILTTYLRTSPQGLPPCRSTCCGWGGLRALMTPRAMLAVA